MGWRFCGCSDGAEMGKGGGSGAEEVEDEEEVYVCGWWGGYRVVVMEMVGVVRGLLLAF